MFKTDILFTGFYGQSNTGDDAFVEVASWGAKKYWKKANNRFLAKSDKLPETMVQAQGYPFTIAKTYGFQAEYLLNRTDAFIFAGGSTVHSKLATTSIRMKAFQRKLSQGKPQIGGIGVSVGPFKSSEDERAVQDYLKQMDFLAVRDQASFDYVDSLDLPYQPINAFDLAALLPEIYGHKPARREVSKRKVIGVSVCPYESVQTGMDVANETKRNKMLVDLLKEIEKQENIHFKFYIINGHDKIGDRNLTMKTINEVGPNSCEILEYSRSTQTIWKSIANCDFVISTRLHAAIFACFAGTPFMLNEYHRKCSDFLYNVAYPEVYRLHDSDYDVKEKAEQILKIVQKNSAYRSPGKVEEMKAQAKLNFTQINL